MGNVFDFNEIERMLKEHGTVTWVKSNGSKWAGEPVDDLDKLIEVLETEKLERRFFAIYEEKELTADGTRVVRRYSRNPINENPRWLAPWDNLWPEGTVKFLGNFEGVSHVFDITTNEPSVIQVLTEKIKANSGWEEYYHLSVID